MTKIKASVLVAAALLSASQIATAGGRHNAMYSVEITNITAAQTFTPVLLATHHKILSIFDLGKPASPELEILAESGDTGPMTELLQSNGDFAADVQTVGGLLEPGKTFKTRVETNRHSKRLSIASMLIPTNDTFVGGDSLGLPRRGSVTYYLKAYDAGTEYNDQNCLNMPGPRCGGEPTSEPADNDEGFVHVSNGFHLLPADEVNGGEVLGPSKYDWRNPVAKVVVKRVY